MALDYQRAPRRFRVYITPPDGKEILWDDCDTVDQANALGESTLVPFRVLDRHQRPEKPREFSIVESVRRLQDKLR